MGQHEAQLEWERRFGRLAAAAAFASAALVVASLVLVQAVVLADRPTNDRGALIAIDRESGTFLVSAIARALAIVAVGVALWYLFRATRYRRPEMPAWLVHTIYIGPLVLAVATVLTVVEQIDVADQFMSGGATRGVAGERRADSLLEDISAAPQAVGLGGSFALAVSFVLVSMNAMRAGLLTRFLGIIGVIIGGLIVLPLLPGAREIVQIFWLVALGFLFLGYWPGGRGEAWETGEAGVWLSAAEQRRQALRESREDSEAEAEEPEPEPEAEPQPASRKRRKRRR